MNELLYFTEAVRNTLSSTKGASIADRCETLLYYSDEQIQTYGYLDMRKKSRFITARKRGLGQANVFTPVCQSFCSQGV